MLHSNEKKDEITIPFPIKKNTKLSNIIKCHFQLLNNVRLAFLSFSYRFFFVLSAVMNFHFANVRADKLSTSTVAFTIHSGKTHKFCQDYLMTIQKHPIKSKFCKLRLLCRSLAGNNVYCLTVTAPVADDETSKVRKYGMK